MCNSKHYKDKRYPESSVYELYVLVVGLISWNNHSGDLEGIIIHFENE
jgi:hypothetical protein